MPHVPQTALLTAAGVSCGCFVGTLWVLLSAAVGCHREYFVFLPFYYYFAFVPSDGKGQRARGGLAWDRNMTRGNGWGEWFVRVERREGGVAADSSFFLRREEVHTIGILYILCILYIYAVCIPRIFVWVYSGCSCTIVMLKWAWIRESTSTTPYGKTLADIQTSL